MKSLLAHMWDGKSQSRFATSPERLMQLRMIDALQRHSVGMFVIDEAHCISKWSAGFRPDYEELSKSKMTLPRFLEKISMLASE